MPRSSNRQPLDFRHDRTSMAQSSEILNHESSYQVSFLINDLRKPYGHSPAVGETAEPDWYLQEWMAHFQKKQASLTNELGWNKGRANHIWHSKQEYKRDLVNEVSAWLGIAPYELLMPPAEALQLRALKQSALAIAASVQSSR